MANYKIICSKCHSDILVLEEGKYKCSNKNCNELFNDEDTERLKEKIFQDIKAEFSKDFKKLFRK